MHAADREALEKAAGPGAVAEHEPFRVDEAAIGITVTPPDADALSRVVAAMAERGTPAVVCCGAGRLDCGNPPRDPALLLSLRGLRGTRELDIEEGVLRAWAGTPLSELRDALDDSGWELPLDPADGRATLGGTLALAGVGPRHGGFGRPRDLVLGLDVVAGDGVRASCGGRVVKNVTGYDLIKLHLGAHGTLGVIEAAWLRLRPTPERVETCSARVPEGEAGLEAALATARRPTVRVAALVDASGVEAVEPRLPIDTGRLLVVELAGVDEAVRRDSEAIVADHDAAPASPGVVGRLRALQGSAFGPADLRFRIAVLPARLPAVLDTLAHAGGATLAYPASGLVYSRFAEELDGDGAAVDAAWRAARNAAAAGGGHAMLESAPGWAKVGRDVFGDAPGGIATMRALKARFDPAGVLNPGRFAGGL